MKEKWQRLYQFYFPVNPVPDTENTFQSYLRIYSISLIIVWLFSLPFVAANWSFFHSLNEGIQGRILESGHSNLFYFLSSIPFHFYLLVLGIFLIHKLHFLLNHSFLSIVQNKKISFPRHLVLSFSAYRYLFLGTGIIYLLGIILLPIQNKFISFLQIALVLFLFFSAFFLAMQKYSLDLKAEFQISQKNTMFCWILSTLLVLFFLAKIVR